MKINLVVAVVFSLTACAAPPEPAGRRVLVERLAAVAQESGAEEGAQQQTKGAKGPHDDFHHHSISVFLGTTFEANETGITGGLDYEYRIDSHFGVGALVDRAWGDFNSTMLAGAVFVHPWEELIVLGALGGEREGGKNSFAGRVGVGYEFPVFQGYSVIPWAYMDFAEGEGASHGVVGVAFSHGFFPWE